MGKASKKSSRRAAKPSNEEVAAAQWGADRYVFPIVIAVSGLVLGTGAFTDQWRGAMITEVQVLAVGAVVWWGLRR